MLLNMKPLNIIFLFSFVFKSGFCQNLDSLSAINKNFKDRKTQEYSISSSKTRIYYQPRWYESITDLPKDFKSTNANFFAGNHALYLAGTVAATLALVPADLSIVNNSRLVASHLGMSEENTYGKFGPLKVVPQNIGAGFYLIGNGITVVLLSSGFVAKGLIDNDYRAYATASGLIESLALSGVYVQALKRITGRESPFITLQNGNKSSKWSPMPSFSKFATQTSRYDAMPSGHVTTIMTALTIISTNYPEYKWIKPIGYTAIGILGFQMLQSEVHWASDYPLALFIGYFTGKSIAQNRFIDKDRKAIAHHKNKYKLEFAGGNFEGYTTVDLKLKL